MVKDVAIFDVDVLASPWMGARELRALAGEGVECVALLPPDTWKRGRRSRRWHGLLRSMSRTQADACAATLDERLSSVGPWIEQRLDGERPPTRIAIVSLNEPDVLLAGVTWAAEMRAEGWEVGLRHVLWELGCPAAGMADEVQRALEGAGRDHVAARGW